MRPSRISLLFSALFWALLGAPAAHAATACITPKTTADPVKYISPPSGAVFTYRITYNPDSKTPDISHHRYRVKSIAGDDVRWFREPVQGKGPIQDVTLHRAFAQVADGKGWRFDFDLAQYDKLWPLKQGNEANYVVEGVKDGKTVMRLQSSYCVRGTKVLKLPAGDFPAHLVDITQKVLDGPKTMKWDLVEVQAWYVPEFGTALLMEDRISYKGKLVLLRRREAVEVPN